MKKPKKKQSPKPEVAAPAEISPNLPLAGVQTDEDLPPLPRELARLLAKERKTGGRPLSMTPRKVRRLLFALQSAASIRACVSWAGVEWSTYRRWWRQGKVEEGKETDPLFRAFRSSCARAREHAETKLVRIIELHAPRDWRAAQALLEAQKPKRYGRRSLDVKHGGGVEVKGLGEAFADFFGDSSSAPPLEHRDASPLAPSSAAPSRKS